MNATSSLRFGEFELDFAGFELKKRGQVIPVQPKVFDLIVHLAKNRDRVVTKDELFQTVWQGVAVTEASLSQAISLARRALDDSPELEHTIRTIRSKGFRFVADANAGVVMRPPVPSSARPSTWSSTNARITALETEQEEAVAVSSLKPAPSLYVALHCESVRAGGARYHLGDTDEVLIMRGSQRSAERSAGSPTKTLTLVLPGRLLSREHARLSRTRDGWVIVDEGSKNGTFVNGERIEKQALRDGDTINCGRNLLRWVEGNVPADVASDIDSRTDDVFPLTSVTPEVIRLGRSLSRIATASLPVLLLGEAGTGKTYTARAIHRMSGRSGQLVTLDAALVDRGSVEAELERARGGTLLLENVERWSQGDLARVFGLVEAAGDAVRVVATSLLNEPELEAALPREISTRVSGFRAELPPLRDRRGDLGALVRVLLSAGGAADLELDASVGMKLLQHSWPGNIAELERCLSAASALAAGTTVRTEHLPQALAVASAR
jgi:DNA-binding winged helix-turn-helix (wHTH) protein